jgi:membrane-associated phospholipid phosphatase
MFGYFAGTLFLFLVNLRWKISIHTMGIAGPTTVLIFVFGYWGALLALLLPPVIWSRVYLKKHTVAQALAGAAVGFLLTAFTLWLLLAYGPSYA